MAALTDREIQKIKSTEDYQPHDYLWVEICIDNLLDTLDAKEEEIITLEVEAQGIADRWMRDKAQKKERIEELEEEIEHLKSADILTGEFSVELEEDTTG